MSVIRKNIAICATTDLRVATATFRKSGFYREPNDMVPLQGRVIGTPGSFGAIRGIGI